MELARILIRELNDYQIIELREVAPSPALEEEGGGPATGTTYSQDQKSATFPIVIGLPKAQAIEHHLQGHPHGERPRTPTTC